MGILERGKLYCARLTDTARIPSKKKEEDGCWDVYLDLQDEIVVIKPHETVQLGTGIISAFHCDFVAILKERGSTGTLGIGQRSGVIDSGYRGEWFVPITNHGNIPIVIAPKKATNDNIYEALFNGQASCVEYIRYDSEKAIAQLLLIERPRVDLEESSVDFIDSIESERGDKCKGSTND